MLIQNQNRNRKGKEMRRFIEYIISVKTEASKISWPGRDQLKKDTLVVFGTCTLGALLYWGVNSGVLALLKSVLGKTL